MPITFFAENWLNYPLIGYIISSKLKGNISKNITFQYGSFKIWNKKSTNIYFIILIGINVINSFNVLFFSLNNGVIFLVYLLINLLSNISCFLFYLIKNGNSSRSCDFSAKQQYTSVDKFFTWMCLIIPSILKLHTHYKYVKKNLQHTPHIMISFFFTCLFTWGNIKNVK